MKFSQVLSRARLLFLSALPVVLVLCVAKLPTFAAAPTQPALASATSQPINVASPIQDDAAAETEAAEEEEPQGDSLMDTFRRGGTIGWLIIALSIVALALVIENFVSLRRDKLAPPELIDEIQALFDEGQYQDAMELCENEPCYFTRVCGAGVAKIGHSFEVIEKSLEEMGDEESIKLHQKIGWLSLIANVAPMMGLLGTVVGMVKAFNDDRIVTGPGLPGRAGERYLPGALDHHVRPHRRHPGYRCFRLPAKQPGPLGDRGQRDCRRPVRAFPPGGLVLHW